MVDIELQAERSIRVMMLTMTGIQHAGNTGRSHELCYVTQLS